LDIPLRTTATLTDRCQETVTDWFNMCREVCSSIVQKRPKMLGTAINPIQIDEARFSGKRKYNRGRLLNGGSKRCIIYLHTIIFNDFY